LPASADIGNERLRLVSHDAPVETMQFLDHALRLLGGKLDAGAREGPVLASVRKVAQMGEEEFASLAGGPDEAPLFLFLEDAAETEFVRRAVWALGGPEVVVAAPQPQRRFRFERDPALWPFTGVTLEEREHRPVGTIAESGSHIEPLITADAGPVFVRWKSPSRRVYLSLVPLPADTSLLKREFQAARFMGLLPVLAFARDALAEHGWRSGGPLASVVIDDPNLRFLRYGFVDLVRLLADSRLGAAHLAIAMIPLDYAKSRSGPARFFRQNPKRLSLVIHGVDHRRCEFESAVSLRHAEQMLSLAVARMALHRDRTGIEHANAMTFPHGRCNETWLRAMRNVGLDAAITDRAFPFRSEDEIDDRLYELHPAQTTFAGFPVVNRFKAEEPKEELLFQAYLGKPLIVYTHHGFFRSGHEPLIEIVEFVEGHLQPRWTDIGTILAANYQLRRSNRGWQARVFSNRARLHAPSSIDAVIKPGREFAADERCWIDGSPVDVVELDGVGQLVAPAALGSSGLIEFGPATKIAPAQQVRASFVSRARRMATELRDQSMGIVAGRLQ